jgi:plastocyanin
MKSRRAIAVAAAVLTCAVGLGRAAGSDDKDKDKGKNKPPAVQDAVVQFGTLATGAAGHILDPDEVTIVKGGTVTWMVNGGGHGIGIYRVDRHTTRADISDDLCQPGSTCTANDERIITDHKGDIVADPGTNPPNTRLNDQNHILLGADGAAFLVGATATTPGNSVQYRFVKSGRYLIICMNRSHALIDWMFGFVNVVGDDDN